MYRELAGAEWNFMAAQNAHAAAIADIVVQLLPRTLGYVIALARTGAASTPRAKAGHYRNTPSLELFLPLADVHFFMFHRAPRTRNASSERCGPSVDWVRRILWIASRKLGDLQVGGPLPNDLLSRASRLSELADLEDASLADFWTKAGRD